MSMIRFREPGFDLIGRRFSDVMDEFFNDAVATRKSTFTPRIDISETEHQFLIDVEVPGMEKEDIHVDLENRTLTISGERTREEEEKTKQVHRIERHYGSFSRSFTLPDNIDEKSVEASYNNGILHIVIGKKDELLKKKIQIS